MAALALLADCGMAVRMRLVDAPSNRLLAFSSVNKWAPRDGRQWARQPTRLAVPRASPCPPRRATQLQRRPCAAMCQTMCAKSRGQFGFAASTFIWDDYPGTMVLEYCHSSTLYVLAYTRPPEERL